MQPEDFFFNLPDKQKQLGLYLHQMLTENFDLFPKIRHKIPFYYRKSWICYLNPIKNDGLELAFLRGNELSNNQGIIHTKGRKQVCGIDLFVISDIPVTLIHEIVNEAIILDSTTPYPSKREK